LFDITKESVSGKTPEELEELVQNLDEHFRKSMEALTSKYDAARNVLMELLGEDYDDDGGLEEDDEGGLYG